MTDANAGQADYWNGGAGQTWVEINRLLDMELKPLGAEAQGALGPKPGERLLDLGCGAGDTSLDLARAVGPQGSVLGVDISRLLLDLAARRAEAAGLKIRFEAADAQTADFLSADFGGQSFDGAFSRFGVMFFSDPEAAFANIRGALRPQGRLAFVCWRPPEENPLMTAPMKAAAHLLPPEEPSDPLAPGPFAFADPERVRRILTGAGFADVAIRPFDARVGGWTAEEALIVAQRVGPLGRLLRENPDLRPKVLEAVTQEMARHAGADGKVRMGAAVWIVTATAP
jgi:ubiquinone/menaquinone biosynthesis C-methylase UbiE